jgi:hypothetical protein
MKQKQSVHEYKGYNGAESHCRLSFYSAPTGATVAVVDELPTNTGTPVREFAEHLATQAYRLIFPPNGIHAEDFLYIEHAPEDGSTEYSYNLVEFDWEEEGEQFIHPRRTPLTEAEVRALIGEEQDTAT